MTQALAVKTTENNIYESLALRGDLSGLKPEDKTVYMQKLCESLGLNPFTQPFIPLKLNGKEILYASRGCTDQLASIHKLTREIIKTERIEDVFVATCKVSAADGRFDISTGAVTLGNLKGDALANALMKAECVPVNYEILTLEGWKSVFDLSEHYTEKVFAYDCEKNELVIAKLLEAKIYKKQQVYRYESNTTRLEFTEGHKWVDRGNLKEWESLNTASMIQIAAAFPNTDSTLCPQEAAVLGWIITDGTIKNYKDKFYRAAICQSKEENFEHIEWACSGLEGEISKSVTDNRQKEWLDQHWWYLSVKQTTNLFQKAGYEKPSDIAGVVLSLSFEAREAMLEAMLRADGDKRGNFTKTKPEIIEAFQLLCTLNGYAVSQVRERWLKNSTKPLFTVRKLSYQSISRNFLELTETFESDVWCPTTAYGTWIMRSPTGQIAITGNTKAKRRATLSFCGLGFLDESELETIPRERFSPPTKAELTKPKSLSPKVEAIKPVVQTLNAKGDSIKWSPAKTNEYVRELFDDENLTVETLSNEQFEIFQGDLQGRLAELEEAEAVRNEADEVIEGTVD